MEPVSNIDEQIECVEREIKQRKHVYPRLVLKGSMTQALADRENLRISHVLATLKAVRQFIVEDMPIGRGDMTKAMKALDDAAPLPPQGNLL